MNKYQQKFDKGVEELRAGNLDKSLSIFNALVKAEPTIGDYWSERGVVYFHLGKKKESLANMDEAVRLQPKKPYRYSSRAYIRGHFKLTQEAIADYEKCIELDPEDAVAQNNLGMLQEQLGYKKEAKKRFGIADDLMEEPKGNTDLGIQGEPLEARNIQKEINEAKKNQSIWSELKSLASKQGRDSFGKFVKSGFKKT
ncbi:tetratricopeptide repeat protein [Vicingaceae bacterium]|nr:tetratricopeptide repeat protein [Vicingaceae bacterium]MDB9964055.1 tetratricopeptide repeat protein [Vicingaceae bacterium]